jgi:hypothetical protein
MRSIDMFPELETEYAFSVKLEFADRQRFGPVPRGGLFGFVGIAGGVIEGPRLQGRALPRSGGDFAQIRPDGVVEFNAHYLFEAADGTPIYVHNTGFGRVPPNVLRPEGSFDSSELMEHYFRVTPRFQVQAGPHDWLNRTLLIGSGERRRNPDHTVFHYYIVR